MAWTQDDVSTLERAIAKGVRRVRYSDGTEVEYQSAEDMFARLRAITAALATQSSEATSGSIAISASKGL